VIRGWLATPGTTAVKQTLELVLDGKILQVTAADQYREDLERAGFADGRCGFELALTPSLSPADAERVQLRIGGTDLCLELPRPRPVVGESAAPATLKVFIVGSPRSGTSVLMQAVQTVCGLPARGESHVIPAIARAVYELAQYAERFAASPEDLLIRSLSVPDLEAALFARVREFYAYTFGGAGWVDKTPGDDAVHGAGLIPRIFPDAKVIVTQRNGIEVVESVRRKFGGGVAEAAAHWVSAMQGVQLLRKSHPEFLFVDQFYFTNASAATARHIAGYLGVPAVAAAFARFLMEQRTDRRSQHDWSKHASLADVAWTTEEKTAFREIAGAMMGELGYGL
jgi:hypothetical protein